MKKMYQNFINVCDMLNKISHTELIVSNGVFMFMEKDSIHILTFNEKIENGILLFLTNKYKLNPSVFVFINKYFTLDSIKFTKTGISFIYNKDYSEEMLKDNSAGYIISLLINKNNGYTINLDYLKSDDISYSKLKSLLTEVSHNYDFDNKSDILYCNTDEILSSIRPVLLDHTIYQLRISKSVFYSVHKNDILSTVCIPNKTNDNVYILQATASKKDYNIINLYNMLKL